MEQPNWEIHKESFEEQFAKKEAIDVLGGKIEAVDIKPEVLKTEVPVLLASGWAASPEVFKDSIKVLFEKNRRVLALERTEENVSENEIDEKLKQQYPIEILRNATALLRLLEEKKIDKVDAVAHSEGVDNISLAFAINPEKFRNIVFIAPPGLTGKDSFYGLAGRFSLSFMKELKKFVLSDDEKEKERIATVVKEAIKYIAKKPARSIKEAIGISRIEIQKNLEDMQKKGVGVAVIAGVDDVVFPMDKMQKNVTKDQFDGFVSVKGVHNEIINYPEQYMAAVDELLDNLEKKKTVREEKISKAMDKISESSSTMTDRDLISYYHEFNISEKDIAKKTILDIGSGIEEKFSKEASKFGAKVFSLNPGLQNEANRETAKKDILKNEEILKWQKRSVGGRAQELPFADESFDMITSLYAVPYYIDSKDGKFSAIKEMMRVLRSGGTARIGPGVGEGKEQENLEQLFGKETIKWLKENNCDLSEDTKSGSVVIRKEFKQ